MPTNPPPADPAGRIAGAPVKTLWADPDPPEPAGPVTWFVFDADGRLIDRGTGPVPGVGGPPAPPPADDPPDEPHVVG